MSGPRERDPGLQPERTLLSWQRTLFLLAVVTLLYLRVPPEDTLAGTVGQLIAVGILFGTSTVLAVHLQKRWRQTDHGRRADGSCDRPRPGPPVGARRREPAVLGISVIAIVSAFPASAVALEVQGPPWSLPVRPLELR